VRSILLTALLGLPLVAQSGLDTALDLSNPVDQRVMALRKAQDWLALADFLEGLPPKDRGRHLGLWLEALKRCQRWQRALEVCEVALPQVEAKTGPKLGLERLLRAQALTKLGRHREAALAHRENGRLGLPVGFENACAEARAIPDWEMLASMAAELALSRPGLGLSLQGEALCKQLKFTEAEPVLERAVQQPGHTAMAWADLACCRVERQAFPEALEAADRALQLEPGHFEGRYNRGRAHFGLKRFAEGRADFAAILESGKADAAMAATLQQNIAAADRYVAFQQRQAEKAAQPPSKKGRR